MTAKWKAWKEEKEEFRRKRSTITMTKGSKVKKRVRPAPPPLDRLHRESGSASREWG